MRHCRDLLSLRNGSVLKITLRIYVAVSCAAFPRNWFNMKLTAVELTSKFPGVRVIRNYNHSGHGDPSLVAVLCQLNQFHNIRFSLLKIKLNLPVCWMEHYAMKAYGGLKIQFRTFLASTVKIKFTLEQATKAQRGSRCMVLLFL